MSHNLYGLRRCGSGSVCSSMCLCSLVICLKCVVAERALQGRHQVILPSKARFTRSGVGFCVLNAVTALTLTEFAWAIPSQLCTMACTSVRPPPLQIICIVSAMHQHCSDASLDVFAALVHEQHLRAWLPVQGEDADGTERQQAATAGQDIQGFWLGRTMDVDLR